MHDERRRCGATAWDAPLCALRNFHRGRIPDGPITLPVPYHFPPRVHARFDAFFSLTDTLLALGHDLTSRCMIYMCIAGGVTGAACMHKHVFIVLLRKHEEREIRVSAGYRRHFQSARDGTGTRPDADGVALARFL